MKNLLGLFKWPLRSKLRVVTYTFRLSAIAGEVETPLERRTYPFTVVVDKTMPARKIESAVVIRAGEMGADMAAIMEREILAALRAEGIDV
jgi:hypothetical protein